ncbi:MAG: hypothetical protein HUU20_06765 [Pirellulales bacterium]|nr:hypothetical protein [Pirellulales bacterium]
MGRKPENNTLRSLVNGLALAAMLLSGAAAVAALFWPGRWNLGFAVLSLRHVERPALELLVSFLVWRLTSRVPLGPFTQSIQDLLSSAAAAWQGWTWNRRAMLALCVVLLPAIGLNAIRWPVQLLEDRRYSLDSVAAHHRQPASQAVPAIGGFADQCSKTLPPDARILFHGGYEAFLFAYEVYPRRVFMLPEEAFAKFAAALHRQHWLTSKTQLDERLEPFWTRGLPRTAGDRETFLDQRRITHEATFHETDVTQCRIESVR